MPALFSEAILEQAIIDKFIAEGYEHVSGADPGPRGERAANDLCDLYHQTLSSISPSTYMTSLPPRPNQSCSFTYSA